MPVPTEGNADVGRPERLDLHAMLWHFLHFRLDVVTQRLEHELEALKKRVHILEGFEKVFDALDEILKIVRKSDGKADAAQQIIKRFALDADQTDAILELKIYRLARLEILIIRKELEEKRRRTRQINTLLKDEQSRWGIVRVEIEEIQKKYGDARRTTIASDEGEAEYTAEDFIVEEDNVVIVSRDGWVKRQKEVKDVVDDAAARRRRGAGGAAGQHARDGRVLQQLRRRLHGAHHRHPGLDRLRRADPAVLQAEGRRAHRRGAQPRSARRRRRSRRRRRAPSRRCTPSRSRATATACASASSRSSSRARAPAGATRGPAERRSSSASRASTGGEILIAATREARAILCKVDEVNFLSGPGRGVILIKLSSAEDRVLGFIASTGDRDLMTVETTRGAEQTISTTKYEVTGRGGKGRELLQRGQFTQVVWSRRTRRRRSGSRRNSADFQGALN